MSSRGAVDQIVVSELRFRGSDLATGRQLDTRGLSVVELARFTSLDAAQIRAALRRLLATGEVVQIGRGRWGSGSPQTPGETATGTAG